MRACTIPSMISRIYCERPSVRRGVAAHIGLYLVWPAKSNGPAGRRPCVLYLCFERDNQLIQQLVPSISVFAFGLGTVLDGGRSLLFSSTKNY
ncbi:hypothetical protein THAOC_17810 [Thalassiosira oceanica]|uniref:Uncharacterized protein n=1 Tax=Thalassiosira oceanica TaxID=159749 RepID=K0S9T6_THAOC|nr:hypothetical protein THAOC_17810 [Thalassiosira oceanica]|eukprot:EJK61659.1 hypothetical protein THAOC_17810 [Thalassiosira oceanica]